MVKHSTGTAAAGLVLVALAVLAVVAVARNGLTGGAPSTVTVGGDKVAVSHLRDAHAGLCEAEKVAPADPVGARADFYDRSHDALHTVARGLEPVDRALAADLLVSMQKVEADLESPPPTLADDLGQLADVYRSGLRRLAITAPPCVE